MAEMWHALRKMLHVGVLFTIFLLLCVIIVDLMILVWSWWPVSKAAMSFDSSSAIFIIAPYPVGGAAISGLQSMILGILLIVIGAVLLAIRRSGRLPGLGGGGTTFVASLTVLSGVGTVALGGYLSATGNLWDPSTVPTILPIPIALMFVQFTSLAQWHSIMIGAILMSAAVLFYREGPPLLRTFRKSISRSSIPPLRTDNALITIPRMYLAILGFYVVYFAFLTATTVEPEVPAFDEMPLWERLHAFAEASVWEEVLSRILMLGLPLLIYHVWTQQKTESNWRYLVGGGFSIDTAAFVLIVLQALIFALAHVAGWDFWKVLPTMISGIAFGYLYLKKGVWASIILHFTFDYLGMTAPSLAEWGIDAGGAMNVIYLLMVLMGLVLMVHYVVIIIKEGPRELREALTERPAEIAKGQHGKAYGPAGPREQ